MKQIIESIYEKREFDLFKIIKIIQKEKVIKETLRDSLVVDAVVILMALCISVCIIFL